jgi:hypothetical protein
MKHIGETVDFIKWLLDLSCISASIISVYHLFNVLKEFSRTLLLNLYVFLMIF